MAGESGGVRMEVVLECPSEVPEVPWPVAERPPYGWLVLSGAVTPDEVGLVVAALAHSAKPPRGTAAEMLRAIASDEGLLLYGGVRVRDGAGHEVVPGCCSGVVYWREWMLLGEGHAPWMGHDPGGWVEHRADAVLVHADEKMPADTIVIPRPELPRLLDGLRADMEGFLAHVREWAMEIAPEEADGFTDAIDRAFVRVDPPPPTS